MMLMMRICTRGLKQYRPRNYKLHEDDLVQVIRGVDKGKQGRIKTYMKKEELIIVDGVNLKKVRNIEDEIRTGDSDIPMKLVPKPFESCNVALVDPSNGKPCRVSVGYLEDGTKVRVSKKTGTIIYLPDQQKKW